MGRLIAAEFQKLSTTRLWLWLLLGAMALTALFASLAIAFSGTEGNPTPPLSTVEGQQTLLTTASGGATPFIAVLAAIGLTGEFRHRTVTATFLATPLRSKVLVAKLITYFLVGAGYAVACMVVTTAIAVPWLSAKGIDILGAGKLTTAVGIVLAIGIFGLIGVGLGALLRDQVATVVSLLIYLFVAEPIVSRIPSLGSWSRFLPGQAEDSLVHAVQYNITLLPQWQGGLLLAGYGVVFAAIGSMLTMRRDVT